jgi:hypothetical protein
MRRLRRSTVEEMPARRREAEESVGRGKSPLDGMRRDATDKVRSLHNTNPNSSRLTLDDPRHWVLSHAREWIIHTFNQMVEIRKQQYEAHLGTIPYYELYKIYAGRPPIPPPQLHELRMQMSAAQGAYQRGIDEDWKNSLQRYPEVLDYYFNLVEFKLPGEKSVAVQEPVFGGRFDPEMKRRESKGRKGMMQPPPMPGGAFMMPPGGPPHMPGPAPGRMPMGMRPGGF